MDKNEEALLGELRHIFSLVNQWLQFAEAKNGALMAFNSALVLGIVGSTKITPRLPVLWLLAWLLLGASMSLLSFFPNMTSFQGGTDSPAQLENAVFYGDVARVRDSRVYLDVLASRLLGDSDGCMQTGLMRDYAEEIIQNSRIAVRKYDCFKVALCCTLVGPAGALLLILLPYVAA